MTPDLVSSGRASTLVEATPRDGVARDPLLAIDGLGKQFEMHHLRRRLAAFNDVSFDLFPGEFVILQGPNGAGKSTLLRTLYRTYRAQTGRAVYRSTRGPIDLVRAADIDIAWLRRTEIGFVTQFLQARPRVSAEEFVAEAVLETAASHAAALQQARATLAAFGLKEPLWPAYPASFSGGEQQKVNLAQALIRPHRLLLLDEPTASLDRGARGALVARIEELKQAGVAMIGVFHMLEETRHLVDRALVLDGPADAPAGALDEGQRAMAEGDHVAG